VVARTLLLKIRYEHEWFYRLNLKFTVKKHILFSDKNVDLPTYWRIDIGFRPL